MFGIGDTLKQAWYGLWVLIDSLVYSLISIAYQVFNLIAKASLYNSENGDIKVMVERISVILGIRIKQCRAETNQCRAFLKMP